MLREPEPFCLFRIGTYACLCTQVPQVESDDLVVSQKGLLRDRERDRDWDRARSVSVLPDAVCARGRLDDEETIWMTPMGASPLASLSATPAAASRLPRPDFNGYWRMKDIGGDWDSFTKDIGYSYLKRKSMGALRWGVLTLTEQIKIDSEGEAIWVQTSSPLSTTVNDLRIDGLDQDAIDPDYVPCLTRVFWEDDVLVSYSKEKATGRQLAQINRWMDGKTMCVSFKSPEGNVAVRYFDREA
eukprot:TRINITY_DN46791_c0_g1_i1.p2 TRINITY_DN46791_c0_g1~~TRINITY_DN46791_c0_g1_i1.p2  ORF type:complete len:243 (+),score=53.85 TRINITY_DN46791_c0_g1_i1:91-819(+)